MKSAQGIGLKYIAILFWAIAINHYILILSSFNIPEFVPGTPVKLYGITAFIIYFITLRLLMSELIKLRPDFTIAHLTLYGAAVCFFAEGPFQVYLAYLFHDWYLYNIILAIIMLTSMFSAIGFLIAFKLKTGNTKRLITLIVAFLLIFNLLTYFFPHISQK
jgi:hypothetical protein